MVPAGKCTIAIKLQTSVTKPGQSLKPVSQVSPEDPMSTAFALALLPLHGRLCSGLENLEAEFVRDGVPMVPGSSPWRQMEALLRLMAEISPAHWIELVRGDDTLISHRAWLAPAYGSYVFAQERTAVAALLAENPGTTRFHPGALPPWGRRAYDRVQDLFERTDLRSCRRLVMVGSGPLPVTLLHILERTPIPSLVAVDASSVAIAAFEDLRRRFGWTRAEGVCCNGLEFDYRGTDAVYLANLVSPKQAILKRMANLLPPGATVILRDPVGAGELLAEPGASAIPEEMTVLGAGNEDAYFLSRHVYLKKRGPGIS
jgi:hypothetical protein